MGREKFNIDLPKISKHISYKYGLAKENDQRVIYITGKGWVLPLVVDETCKVRIEKVHRKFNRLIGRYLATGDVFSKHCISEFSIPIDNFQEGKKKFMQFECYLRQIKDMSVDEMREDVEKGVKKLSKELEIALADNKFQVTKRK